MSKLQIAFVASSMAAGLFFGVGYGIPLWLHWHEIAVAYWGPIFFQWGWY